MDFQPTATPEFVQMAWLLLVQIEVADTLCTPSGDIFYVRLGAQSRGIEKYIVIRLGGRRGVCLQL